VPSVSNATRGSAQEFWDFLQGGARTLGQSAHYLWDFIAIHAWHPRTNCGILQPARTTAFPCTRIGRLLGGRDHATVMHGVALIAVRLVSGREEDASLRQMVRALGATLDATYEAGGVPGQQAA